MTIYNWITVLNKFENGALGNEKCINKAEELNELQLEKYSDQFFATKRKERITKNEKKVEQFFEQK